MKNVLLIVFLLVFSINLVKAQGLGSENKPDYLESIKLIDKNKGTMSSGVNPSLPIEQELANMDFNVPEEEIRELALLLEEEWKKKEEQDTLFKNVPEEEIRELALLLEEEWKKKEEQDTLFKAQKNKPNGNSKVMEDVSFWDAYGKSFVETLFVLISIMIGFSLLKLLIKGFKKLRRIKVKDLRNYPTVINFKEKTINYIKSMNSKDIIIFSIILGVLVGLCFGYLSGDTKYLIKKGVVVSQEYYIERGLNKHLNKYFNFNYIIGVASFIITAGVSYLYLSKKGSE